MISFNQRYMKQSARFVLQNTKRYASVRNVRFIQSKASLDKIIQENYKEKLEQKAKIAGFKDANELRDKLKEEIEEKKKKLNKIDPLKELEDYEKAMNLRESLKGKKKDLGPIDPSKPKEPYKTLESYLVVDKLKDLSIEQIGLLWKARFTSNPQSLFATIPSETFERLYLNARKNPTFVLPLPKHDAILNEEDKSTGSNSTPMEIHFIQWSFVGPKTTHCMITSLMEFKLHKEYAKPHTTISFHQELEDSKNVVLMNGQVEKEAAITLMESQVLLLNLQRFYGGLGTGSEIEKERLNLLEEFNKGSKEFSMDKCITLSENLEN